MADARRRSVTPVIVPSISVHILIQYKPYACGVAGCNKRYTDPSSLRKHVKNHNQKDPAKKKNDLQKWFGIELSRTDTMHAYSPAPPDMLNMSPGRRPHPHLRHPGMYQNMEMGMMQAPNPHAEKWYQQWVENGGEMPPMETKTDMPTPHAFALGNCRMQNVSWNPQMEEFGLPPDMQAGNGEFTFDGAYHIMSQEEAQQQFLQMNAVDRPVSRLSGIMADGDQ
ncbi:GLIS3-like protein [Mya arenaria]|uniref:GLIS3-like protein n=1 Tax=Mya arenaria TaxID=6604 RepID=A0ABY7FPR8_MYAAR|nr:GLIS3-like protein [Mya arenaria]